MIRSSEREGTCLALAEVLLRVPGAEAVEVLRIPVPPSVEDRPGASAALRRHAGRARELKPQGDSFTETFIAVAEQAGDYVPALEVVAFHQPLSAAREQYEVTVDDLASSDFSHRLQEAMPDEMVVVTSRVRTDSGIMHLPLLDLKLHRCAKNDPIALAVASRLGGGTVIDSGSSYHLYGHRLKTEDQFFGWLLEAQLLSRVVDTRWVTHQLIERRAALRLSRGGGKQSWPRVVSSVAGSDAV